MRSSWRMWIRSAALAASLLFVAAPALAMGEGETLIDWAKGRKDLSSRDRAIWEKTIRLRFGGAALEEERAGRPEIKVAKEILSAGIFLGATPKKAADAAWNGWAGAIGYVPPPIAVHYEILSLQGRKPRGRPIDLAFHFPDYYNEEIAPELVAYWEQQLEKGTIPDDALEETKEALAATRILMRPLLLDKLRLLARLGRELAAARGTRKAEIEQNLRELDAELAHAFSKVARRPVVIDPRKRPFDRLLIQLEDMGLTATPEDRALDPDAAPPPPKEVPTLPELDLPRKDGSGVPLAEPEGPPPVVIPPQPQPGGTGKFEDPVEGRPVGDLVSAYAQRLGQGVEPWLGTPYRWGSQTPRVGTDCSGFTRGVMDGSFGLSLPRVSRDQYRLGTSVPRDGLKPGDLVFFDTLDTGRVSHVGVYAGDGRFAHASASRGVVYDQLESRYFNRAYLGARRVLAYP